MIEQNILKMANDEFAELNEHDARALTDQIKEAAESLWSLLSIAHGRKAWKALGYITWETYISAEFQMGRAHSYRLLNQAYVIKELGAAAGLSPNGDIVVSEKEARDIKPVIHQVTERIREQVAQLPPERVQQEAQKIVTQVISEERSKLNAAMQTREDLAALADELGVKVDPDKERSDAARVDLMQPIYNIIEELSDLPPAAQLARNVRDYERDWIALIPKAIAWLKAFEEATR